MIEWKVEELFPRTFSPEEIILTDTTLKIPEEALTLAIEGWNKTLSESQKKHGGKICPYEDGLDALYDDNEILVMWPGKTRSLVSYDIKDASAEFCLAHSRFFLNKAIDNQHVLDIFSKHNIRPPTPFSQGTLLELEDAIPLVLRGGKVTEYAWHYSHLGGGIDKLGDVGVQQESELQDELGLSESAKNIRYFGLIANIIRVTPVPSLFGYWPIKRSSAEVFSDYSNIKIKQPDAIDLVFAPIDESELMDYLVKSPIGKNLHPKTKAGFFLWGGHKFGEQWAQDYKKKTI